jgi:DNA helicase-2/ATP-dependent DNA helicase PcrA
VDPRVHPQHSKIMTKTTKEFEAAYKQLNAEQKKAVDTIEGPVMLVAGPGTGKTQTLALRIANILQKTDTLASSILALTFTESGARAMRTRLAQMIGAEAYYANIATFHAFCIDIIKENPDLFILDPSAEPLSDLEKLRLIYRLLDTTKLTQLRPLGAPRHYAKAILGAISDLKREGVSPDEFDELLKNEEQFLNSDDATELKKTELAKRFKNLGKNKELNLLYRSYQDSLKKSESFDFEDMINTVVEAFKTDEELLRIYQEKFLYILVDEYQDTNSAQNQLLLQLSSFWDDKANIFVTGDPDQSIMRFQGASIENQLSFIKVYPSAEVITLKQNYRSSQNILDISDSLISHNNLRINDVVPSVDPHLVSQIGAGNKIDIAQLSGSTAETIFLAESIKAKIDSGVAPRDIAIIYHTNREATIIADTLVKFGIDYSVQGGANVLSDPTVRNFLKILHVIYEMRSKDDDEDLFTILHYDIFGIDPLDVLKISRLAGDKRLNFFEVLSDSSLLDSLTLNSRLKIDATLTKLAHWQELDAGTTFTEFFETVLNESGYLTWVLSQPDAHHRLARLNTLFDEVKRMNRADHHLDLSSFIANLHLMEDNNLRLEESTYGISRDAITLTTAHKSKGLEWEHVYIYRAVDGVWGNNQVRNLITLPENVLKNAQLSRKEKNEDERRLFYVAITRAKSSLTICYANTYSSFGNSKEAIPAMFISELGEPVGESKSLLQKVNTEAIEEEAHKHIEKLLTVQAPVSTSKEEIEFLGDLVSNFKLAATSLNSYLYCAYKFKLDKLLKVPHAKKAHLSYGTAVHKALEKFYLKYKDEQVVPSKDYLLEEFRAAIDEQVINKVDLAAYKEKGEEVLSSYYDFNLTTPAVPLATEKNIKSQLGDIEITGKLDRLEWVSQADKTVRVVDYKTGKAKTMGQIEGTTQDSDGELQRQLEFYKLLIDSDKGLNYKFGEGMLDFVEEAREKGKSGERRFQVTDEQIEGLKQTILTTMQSIRSLQFPRTTDLKKCEKCYFLDHCYPNGLPVV